MSAPPRRPGDAPQGETDGTLVAELKRRKVLRTGTAYVVGALAAWGAMDFAAEAFTLPSWILRNTVIASVIGFPLALIAAWFLDVRVEREGHNTPLDAPREVLKAVGLGVTCGVAAFLVLAFTLGRAIPAIDSEVPGFGGRGAIAVLPFDDLSEGGENGHFADGIAEEILVSLQGWGIFPVISRGSTFGYRDEEIDIPTVASQLGVRYVLEGSVRRADETVRVSVRLIDAESDIQIWADRFDGSLSDIFAVQDAIAEEIVTAIAPEITRSEMRRTSEGRPSDLAAWELILRAQALILSGTYESALEARSLLELALEREPGYALAYARLAEIGHDASNNLSRQFGNDAAVAALEQALSDARRAVQLAPNLVDGRIWLGHLLLHDKQIVEGLVELEEAVRLNPSHAQARAELGFALALEGEVDAAMQELSLAVRLSPNDPRNDRIRTFEALAKLYAGNYEEAAHSARGVIDVQPESPAMIVPRVVEISALVRQGRLEEARERAAEYLSYLGEVDWPAIARGAWSREELGRVEDDLRSIGLLD